MSKNKSSQILGKLLKARQAGRRMATLSGAQRAKALREFARLIKAQQGQLLRENRRDLAAFEGSRESALFQRLKLDEGKLKQLHEGLLQVAEQADPVGRLRSKTLLDDGLVLEQRSVPMGVVAVVFESRPDVIPQILSLVLKSGNAALLKGGREALHSNRAFMRLAQALRRRCVFLPTTWAQLLESREDVAELLRYPQHVDLVIPRGSNRLVQTIQKATRIPVLGHADGVCHIYVHAQADLRKALSIVMDAKTQYPSACNAVETLLVDAKVAKRFVPDFAELAWKKGVTLKGCSRSRALAPRLALATERDWRREYGDTKMNIRVVRDLAQAVEHINHYGSHHTDAILTRNLKAREEFLATVDSACVFANCSTRFADGFRFGLGAEVGISTARTHARGPVGVEGLLTYKWLLRGHGQRVAEYIGTHARKFLHKKS